jgi:hypothetical protein
MVAMTDVRVQKDPQSRFGVTSRVSTPLRMVHPLAIRFVALPDELRVLFVRICSDGDGSAGLGSPG